MKLDNKPVNITIAQIFIVLLFAYFNYSASTPETSFLLAGVFTLVIIHENNRRNNKDNPKQPPIEKQNPQ